MFPVIGIAIYLTFCLLVGLIADRAMYRSMGAWALLAFLFSPLVAFVFLLVAGPPASAAEQLARDDASRSQSEIADDQQRAEFPCPSCGAAINFVTRAGLRSPQDEPWRIYCTSCDHEIDADQL